MNYAPILITTLNRYEHLKRCLSSLANNTLAKESEIYIGVDYPPSEKYRDGYSKVIDYLKNNTFLEKQFKKVKIFYHNKNLGPSNNMRFLTDYVKSFSKTFISTEDDNVFSKNFLLYQNECLNTFENDERIIAVCGCKETEWLLLNDKDTIIPCKLYSPYGCGGWFNKRDLHNRLMSEFILKSKSIKKLIQLRKRDRVLFNIYVSSVMLNNQKPFWIDGKLRCIDSVKSIFLHMTDYICVVPSKSKSHTTGNDGSGVNMKRIDGLDPNIQWPLDSDENFTIMLDNKIITPTNYKKEIFNFIYDNYAIGNDYMSILRNVKQDICADLGFLLLILCNFDRDRAIRIKNIIKYIIKSKQ